MIIRLIFMLKQAIEGCQVNDAFQFFQFLFHMNNQVPTISISTIVTLQSFVFKWIKES